MIKRKLKIILILSFVFFAEAAIAYIPHSYFILNKMSEDRPKDTKILVQSQLRFFDESSGKLLETFTEELEVDMEKGFFVLRIFDTEEKLLFTRDLTLSQTDADISPTLFMFFSHNGADISHSLLKKGVPIVLEKELEKREKEADRRALEHLSLQKLESGYAWLIGEKEKGASLWVMKDLFRPLKLVVNAVEVNYKEFQALGGISYPTKISLVKNEIPFITLDVLGTKRVTKVTPSHKKKWEYPSSKREHFQKYIDLLR